LDGSQEFVEEAAAFVLQRQGLWTRGNRNDVALLRRADVGLASDPFTITRHHRALKFYLFVSGIPELAFAFGALPRRDIVGR